MFLTPTANIKCRNKAESVCFRLNAQNETNLILGRTSDNLGKRRQSSPVGTLALPQRTSVPIKAMLLREAMSPLVAAGWWEVDLEQGLVSPVRLDSSTDRSVACGGAGVIEHRQIDGTEPFCFGNWASNPF